jgi:hypothetical protein
MTENKTPDPPPATPDQAQPGGASPPKTPPAERGPNGSGVSEQVRNAHAALAQAPARDPVTKRFVGPNVAAGTTLERSAAFWSAVEPAKRELVERVRGDLAVDASTVEMLLGLIDAYAEVRLFRTSMFLRLVDQGGPITTKGKARALYRAYLDALDRETKLAQVLGLERRSKPTNPIDAVRAAVVEANR